MNISYFPERFPSLQTSEALGFPELDMVSMWVVILYEFLFLWLSQAPLALVQVASIQKMFAISRYLKSSLAQNFVSLSPSYIRWISNIRLSNLCANFVCFIGLLL